MYVSGWTGEGAPTGLGESDGTVLSDAAEWIRDRWSAWLALEPAILDLQHRAAVVAANANQAGDAETYTQAREIILDLGKLGQLHLSISDKVRSLGSWLGLDSLEGYGGGAPGTVGAIPVPVALATTFAALALVMGWLMSRVELQRSLVAGLEDGTLTREDLEALAEQPPATDVLSRGVDLARLGLWAFLAFVAWKLASEVGGWRDNPDLLIFEPNPGDGAGGELIGERVHALSYRHAEDGGPYVHDFGPEVELYGLEDGTVQLRHRRGRRLWRDF